MLPTEHGTHDVWFGATLLNLNGVHTWPRRDMRSSRYEYGGCQVQWLPSLRGVRYQRPGS